MRSMEWKQGQLYLLDQTKLPSEITPIVCDNYRIVADAIKTLKVRGAPAIGAAAAFGIVLGAKELLHKPSDFLQQLHEVANVLRSTRPTAVNLFWAIDKMMSVVSRYHSDTPIKICAMLEEQALQIADQDVQVNKAIGEFGAALIDDGISILTHCNAGALATVDFGTALGVIRHAWQQGKKIHVFADETRPLLQGARLTAWELMQEGIPVTLITDNMAGYVMQLGKVQAVIVGADRVALNGDVANKIGTYSVAVLAKEHNIPFYVAAPLSTFDRSIATGKDIPIEERTADEVRNFGGYQTAPTDVPVFNPAFDITPARYVAALITEKGVIKPPFETNIKTLLRGGNVI